MFIKTMYIAQSLLLIVALLLISPAAYAQELSQRSLESSSSVPSAQTIQTVTFTMPSLVSIGSIELEHCTNSPIVGKPCTPPIGFSLSSATLTNQLNNIGFTIDIINSTVNKIVLTRIPAVVNAGPNTYEFSGVVNSSVANQTTFVRISTFASTDASGPRQDIGAAAYATLDTFSIGVFVPPFLIFCAGVTVALDCTSSSGSLLDFGELSAVQTKSVSSQFAGATNDPLGYNVYVEGQTMTAGNLVIPALAAGSGSSVGTGQFGINLRQNTAPSVGADPVGIGTALATANYNLPNTFRFVNGEQIASSSFSTDYNLHTVSYIVNVSSDQAPGYYATTMTYIAVAAF